MTNIIKEISIAVSSNNKGCSEKMITIFVRGLINQYPLLIEIEDLTAFINDFSPKDIAIILTKNIV